MGQETWVWRARLGALYFATQGAGALLWWVAMWFVPAWRVHFRTDRISDLGLLDFAWPDVPMVVVGSLVCAVALMRAPKGVWTQRLVWVTVGGTVYPALYVTGATFASAGQGWAATMAMLAAASGSFLAAWTVRPDGPLFRVAPKRSAGQNVARTFGQTVIFWASTLALAPWLLLQAGRALGVPGFETPAQAWMPWVLFVLLGALNLHTGYTMSTHGEGTPLPLDTASKLVVQGAYRYMRNPMATSGLGLGLMVAWWLGSWAMILAVIAGGIFWHAFVRPIEEDDLTERFGDTYQAYKEAVPCWIPRLTPYAS